MPDLPVSVGEGRHMVRADCTRMGTDIVLCFSGGTHPHIGAVALAEPRQSLRNDGTFSASASVLCVTGHKEDLLARELALRAATQLRCRVVVTAGLHVENAAADDLRALSANCTAALELVLQNLTQNGHEAGPGSSPVGLA